MSEQSKGKPMSEQDTARQEALRRYAVEVLDAIPQALGMSPPEWVCDSPLTCGHFCIGVVDAVADVIHTALDAAEQQIAQLHEAHARLTDALVELQSASWSRQWSRVLAARERVRELTGIEVPGPLKAALKRESLASPAPTPLEK